MCFIDRLDLIVVVVDCLLCRNKGITCRDSFFFFTCVLVICARFDPVQNNCECAIPPEVILCGWRDVKIRELIQMHCGESLLTVDCSFTLSFARAWDASTVGWKLKSVMYPLFLFLFLFTNEVCRDRWFRVYDELVWNFLLWGTADADIVKVSSVESPELTDVLPLKPGVGQNIALLASPTARNSFLVLISTFSAHTPSKRAWITVSETSPRTHLGSSLKLVIGLNVLLNARGHSSTHRHSYSLSRAN